MTIRRITVGLLCACATSLVWARTGTVSVEKDGETFNVTFANHANETNGLWVVYGAADRGEGTNGWEHVEFLQTVYPETGSVTYPVPAGWGDTVKAIRFILSEVPYDVDYTLTYLRNDQKNRIVLKDFIFKGSYRLVTKMNRVSFGRGSPAFFYTRDGGSEAKYFGLFETGTGTSWRFDYNDSNETVSGSKSIALENGTDYLIDASYLGLYVNSTQVLGTRTGKYFTDATAHKLEFFCGNTSAGTMANDGHVLLLYFARIYDYLDESGNVKADQKLLVDLVPAVKGGVVGVYDAVSKDFLTTDTTSPFVEVEGTRVESADPFFASGLYKTKTTGPEVFAPVTYTEDSTSYTNEFGGVLDGPSVLKLTGENDWGGQFTISNGTLVAAFGHGLGVEDNLMLVGGYYGGFDGQVTNAIGVGPGEISVVTGKYLAFAAVDGDLRVNIGDKGEPWTPTADMCRLSFGSPVDEGVLTFENPIYIPKGGQEAIVRNATGKSVLSGNVTSEGGAKINLYGVEDFNEVGETVFAGATNTFATFNQLSGGWTLGAGTTNVVNGNFNVEKGLFLATNAVVRMTGALGYSSSMSVTGGKACFYGGEALFGGITIGESKDQSSTDYLRPQLILAGKMTLDGSLSANVYGSMTINSSSASYALTLEDGADVQIANLNFYQRNVIHRGGTLVLTGTYGLNKMGEGKGSSGGTSRYVLDGGRLEARKAIQSTNKNAKAYFCFSGGTLANRIKTDTFFENFGPDSRVEVANASGGTFEVNYDTAITNDVLASNFRTGKWNYSTADYLTAPAFTKTGAKTLTLSGACSYACATDVAAGALKLEGERAALPETGVVRVTGGTLDLGGKAQSLKALCGTAGEVKNGSVTVTEGIYPGGAGTIGSFSVGAALSGTLFVDVDATGAADSITTTTALDLSNIDLVITAPATAPEVPRRLKIVNGPHTGTFKSVSGLPAGWTLRYSDGRVSIGPDRGVVLFFR